MADYTSQAAIERVLSSNGLLLRLDHDSSGAVDSGTVQDLIDDVRSEIDSYVSWRYTNAVLAGDRWIQRAAAYLGAYFACTTRGHVPPDGVIREYERVMERLKALASSQWSLAGVDQRDNLRPSVTNYRVRSGYQTRKVRVVRELSTGGDGTPQRDLDQVVPET